MIKLNDVKDNLENNLNKILKINLCSLNQEDEISKLEKIYADQIKNICKVENLEKKKKDNIEALINISNKFNIRVNKETSIEKLNNYIQNLDKLMNKYENKIYLNFNKYSQLFLHLYNKTEEVNESAILNLAKEINKKENSKLLEPLNIGKWWSLKYWLNKSKNKKQKENKLIYKNKENEISNTLIQYKKQVDSIIDDIKFIDEIIFDYPTIEVKLLTQEDITEKILRIKEAIEEYKIILEKIKSYRQELSIAKNNLSITYAKLSEIKVNLQRMELEVKNNIETKVDIKINDGKVRDESIIDNKDKNTIIPQSEEIKNNESIEVEDERDCKVIENNKDIERIKKIDILIEEYFNENKFNMFVSYCKDNDLAKLEELEDFDFDSLLSLRGFGVGKVKNIEEKFELCNGVYNKNADDEDVIQLDSEKGLYNTHPDYDNLNLEILASFKVNSKIVNKLKAKYNTLGDLRNIDIKQYLINQGINKYRIDIMLQPLNKLKNNREILFKELFDEIKENKNYDILIERSNGRTLVDIGEEKGVTRERIRQLENKIIKEKMTLLICMNDEYIISNLKNKHIFDIEELAYLIEDEQDLKVIDYCLKKDICDSFKYFDEIEKYIVNNNIEDIKIMLDHTLTNLEEVFSFEDENIDIEGLLIENYLDFLSVKDYENYLINTQYKKKGKYLIKGATSKSKIYGYVVKEFFNNGINFNNENQVAKLRSILENEFDTAVDENDRAMKSNIDRVCILRDVSTLIHPDHINIDYKLLNQIKKYIDNYELNTLYIASIYEEFKSDLNKFSNVDNRDFLHGVIKYFYNEEYSFTRDTVFKNKDRLNSGEILEKYLREKGKPVSREEIKKNLIGWTDIMFDINLRTRKDILHWDISSYVISDFLKIDENNINNLRTEVKLSMIENDGYTNTMILYNKLKPRMKMFFEKNNIENYNNLYAILIYLFEDEFRFRRPHILENDIISDINMVNVIRHLLKSKEYVTTEDIKSTVEKLQIRESTSYVIMEKIKGELISIDGKIYRFRTRGV